MLADVDELDLDVQAGADLEEAFAESGPSRDAAPMPSRRGLTRTLHLLH